MIPFDRLHEQYGLIRNCLEGEDAVKASGQLYTPKPEGMTPGNYVHYLDRGCFYGAPAMTLRALTGLALRKDPVIKLPARLEPMRLNATDENAPMSVLIEDMVREVMAMGRYGVLLDFPATGATANTVPHIATFKAEAIEDFDTAYVDGRKVLTRVWLASDETWEEAAVYYELILDDSIYKFRRFIRDQHQRREDVGDEVIPTVNGRALNYIPFLLVSQEGLRPENVTPPFLALCQVALSHFKNSCDREHAIFLTASPTPWISGSIPEDRVPSTIGSGTVWTLPEGCQVGMLEFTGAGVAAQKELMQEKVDTMATLGARMLSVTMNRNETIDTATQRTRSELALLHGVVVSVEAALNRLLHLAAEWVGAPADEASVNLSRDFIEIAMDPKMVEAQLKLWQSGMISRATLYENLQKGEIARSDRSWADEKDMVEEEGGDLTLPVSLVKSN
ncbi:hypothetical protein GCM10008024_20740 [Allgaiera indica]|uniref:DUF4055 domain-containing protein n=1 Tax=Allgaiera indica TaxID=765699 RepID=A0AAN4URT9_9RHOB|nr:DUF4055 domain-containing protein [Allgaiera indica]GHE02176.1 hypothetical protein GCM10008024_20740 [Allgaiera indica]SDX06155.1 protein of unknown function [Allgaiera indica]